MIFHHSIRWLSLRRLRLRAPARVNSHSSLNDQIISESYKYILQANKDVSLAEELSGAHSDYSLRHSSKGTAVYDSSNRQIFHTDVLRASVSMGLQPRSASRLVQVRRSLGMQHIALLLESGSTRGLFVKFMQMNLTTEVLIPSEFGVICDMEWTDEGQSLYVLTASDALRPNKLLLVELSQNTPRRRVEVNRLFFSSHPPSLLLHEADEEFFLSMRRSRCGTAMMLHAHSKKKSEITLFPICNQSSPRVVFSREVGVRAYLQLLDQQFLGVIRAAGAYDRIVRWPIDGDRHLWEVLWPSYDIDHRIEDVDFMHGDIIVYGTSRALPMLRRLRVTASGAHRDIDLVPGILSAVPSLPRVFDIQPGVNTNPTADFVMFSVSALTLRPLHLRLNLQTGGIENAHPAPNSCMQNVSGVRVYQEYCYSRDKERIPLTIASVDTGPGQRKFLLSAYGAYGECISRGYSSFHEELLRRGWSIALVHCRGGGELGEKWHEAGRESRKLNSFLDHLAAAEFLIHRQLTSPELLVGEGTSAGGLILGSAANSYPQLFSGLIFRNAYLNVSGLVSDCSQSNDPLSLHEVAEWGCRTDKETNSFINQYCPLQNVKKQNYPSIYISYGSADKIVNPINNALLWWSKVSAAQLGHNPIILKMFARGHYDAISIEECSYESSLEVAFLEHCVCGSSKKEKIII